MTETPIDTPLDNSAPPALEAKGLVKHFPIRFGPLSLRRGLVHAVEDVSLRLDRASVTAVVGESGSGKSTIGGLLARLHKPTAGDLLLAGAPATDVSDRAYRARVQMVLQDPFSSLNPVHGVRYHLARPLQLHHMTDGDLDTAIHGLLDRVSLTPTRQFIEKYPHELSGGQRQRVAIARALAVRPEVLIADEPVSMLDVSIRLGILNLLADLRETEGLAILYVTHDIGSARYLADTIAVMYAGQLVETGPATEVTDNPAHPYTQLLRSAAPDPAREGPVVLAGRGTPPSLVNPPTGCRFHPRCPHAMPVCETTAPPRIEVNEGHISACWLHTEQRGTERPAATADTGAA